MTRLEYGAISHNSGDNRNPMDRDSGGLNIMKQALETRRYELNWRLNESELTLVCPDRPPFFVG